MSLPSEVLSAMVKRNEAREELAAAEVKLQAALKPHAGVVFTMEGVPFKVCGGRAGLYLRRMVSASDAVALREKWRAE